jgi:DNA replication factor GINS
MQGKSETADIMYERIYDYWKREKAEPNLQSIDKDFYEDLTKYIGQLRDCIRNTTEKSVKTKLAEAELERVRDLSRELLETRLHKILGVVESNTDSGGVSQSVIGEERTLFGDILQSSQHYQSMIRRIMTAEQEWSAERISPVKPQKVTVRFLQEIPAIIGTDLKPYGPFKPEDVATLPKENAEILIKRNVVLRIGCE